MSEVIYSAQRSGFLPGRIYRNPKYFHSVTPGVTSVAIIGDWPAVRAAYKKAGVPIKTSVEDESEPEPEVVADDPVVDPADGDSEDVEIPESFLLSAMNFKELKALVEKVDSSARVASKKDAVAFLESKR